MNWVKKYIFTDESISKGEIRPIFLIRNTSKLAINNGKFIYKIIFLSEKTVGNLQFYYHFSCVVDSESHERLDSEFKILTKNDRTQIINEIKNFVNCLSDRQISVFTFEQCTMSNESAQKFMEDVLTREC